MTQKINIDEEDEGEREFKIGETLFTLSAPQKAKKIKTNLCAPVLKHSNMLLGLEKERM